ncbi:MAG: hypothetical protein RLZ33_1092 [Bacteroidota bacterium]|jgi:hypothetical protein
MKNTTLRLNSSASRFVFCGSITLFSCLNTFAQEQNTKSELRAIQVPVFANETERQEWILSHPDEYLFLKGELKSTAIQLTIDEFPSFIDTGDVKKDIEDHQKRKNAWISAHPEEYLRMQETFTPSPEQLEIMNAKTTKTN